MVGLSSPALRALVRLPAPHNRRVRPRPAPASPPRASRHTAPTPSHNRARRPFAPRTMPTPPRLSRGGDGSPARSALKALSRLERLQPKVRVRRKAEPGRRARGRARAHLARPCASLLLSRSGAPSRPAAPATRHPTRPPTAR